MANVNSIDNKDEWVNAVAKLIEMTQKREISWTAVEPLHVPPLALSSEKVIDAFESKHLGQRLFLSRHSYSASIGGTLRRNTIVALRFVSSDGIPVYRIPYVEALDHLLEEARLQSTNVRDYLNKLLSSK